jgi:basic amino acid/polyamine antiporter, APA family
LTYIGFTLGLSTAATVLGLVRLRRREGVSLRVPGWPWVPALFLVSVLGTTGFSIVRRPTESLLSLATMGIGWLAWRLSKGSETARRTT